MFFLPAATVAEAVTRIFSLTGAAEAGTRGEKRAIVALRDALGLDIDVARTNARMAQQIAEVLRVEWRPSYEELMALGEIPQGRSSNFPTLGGCHCSGRRVPVAA